MNDSNTVRVRFWGVRGSVPAPGPRTSRYGGNTPCVTLEAPGCDLIILDAGTGIRCLGVALLEDKRLPLKAHLLLSHTHWDHIQGFPFFAPAFIPGNTIVMHGGLGSDRELAETLKGQMLHRYFPVSLDQLGADIEFRHCETGARVIGGMHVNAAELHHTGPTVGYRLQTGGCTVVYATDTEPRDNPPDPALDPVVLELARGADVLIHDAQYTDDEYPRKLGWGHSPIGYAVKLAMAAGVARLVLFHHDPMHDDAAVDAMLVAARDAARAAGSTLHVDAASEGLEILLPVHAPVAAA